MPRKFFDGKESVLADLKIPRTIFCLFPFQIFEKAHLQI